MITEHLEKYFVKYFFDFTPKLIFNSKNKVTNIISHSMIANIGFLNTKPEKLAAINISNKITLPPIILKVKREFL